MKCVNCNNLAIYSCSDPGVNPVDYCGACLPTWLRDRAARNEFPLRESEAPTKKSSKKESEQETKAVEEE